MATQDQKRKAAAQTGLYLVVILGIVVTANVLSSGLYRRYDATKTERYTLSQGSGRLVSELKQPLQVDAYVTRGLAQLDAFTRDLTDLLKEYERAGKGKLKFTLIEATTDEQKEAAKEAGLQPMMLGEASATGEDQASIKEGYMGLVLKYGSEKAPVPLPPSRSEGLEFWITNKIREVRDKADDVKHKVGVITGKDELKLSDTNLVPRQGQGKGAPSMQSIMNQAFPFYTIEEVDLKNGDDEIDKDFAGLIMTQPRKDFTDKELRRIDQFLMRGGKALAVFASAVTFKPQDPTMSATLDLHGIDKLLAGYGINMKKDAVLDHGGQMRLLIPTQAGMASVRHPGIAHVVNDPRFDENEKLLDTTFAGFFRMEEMEVPFPSSIELLKDKQPADVKLYPVARTTPATSVETSGTVDMKLRPEWKPKPPYEQKIIAAVAEGKLKSAYAGGDKQGVEAPDKAPNDSRVLVVASGQFLTNPFAYAGNGPDLGGQFAMFGGVGGDQTLMAIAGPYAQRYLTNTILALKNTLDWMSGDVDLIATSAKILQEPSLTYSDVSKPKIVAEDDEAGIRKKDEEYKAARKTIQGKVQWSLTAALPILFAAFGLLRWWLREQKRGQVKA